VVLNKVNNTQRTQWAVAVGHSEEESLQKSGELAEAWKFPVKKKQTPEN